MTNDDERQRLRWKLKPFPELVRLAWPIAVSMLSYSIMTLVDTMFAGRLGATAVGAVGFGGVVAFTLLSFGIGLLRSAKVVVSQAVGAGRQYRISGAVGAALVLAAGTGLATGFLGQGVALGLHLLADESRSVHLAQRYVALRLLGAPIVLVGFAIREIRCAIGDARSPMQTALVANTLHIPMNFFLIFEAGLGVTGAALSTVLAQIIETTLLVRVQKRDGLGLSAWGRRDLQELFRMGWPLGLERLFNVASFTVLVTLVARVSDTDLAAHQVAHQVALFALLPMMAIGEAAAVLSGQAVGADEDGLVRRVGRIAVATGAGYGAICATAYILGGPLIASTLTNDAKVQTLAVKLLRVAAAWQAFDAAYLVSAAVLRGVGDVRFVTTAMVVVAWVVTPPLAVLLGFGLHLGALGGWLALLLEWATGAFVLGARVEGNAWRKAAIRARERVFAHGEPALVAEPAR